MSRTGADPFVEQVRLASDIVAIIGGRAELKRIGARWRGLCPFHGERTPSFYVSPDYQTYHCFGCGASGDVFTFVMQQENLTFPEALRHLAERAGIPVPDRKGPTQDRLEQIRQALKVARRFYVDQLAGNAGHAGREYLDRRGIGPLVRERYGLGTAPDAWDGLLRHARPMVSERTLVEAGLVVEKAPDRLYDRFRDRLMVPIDSSGGMPVGFGGRAMGDEEPKYLNSPETAVYRKGTVLFGVAQARDAIRREGRVLVVEGYFDVLALAEGGIENVVGTCGTALTPDQARQLARLGVQLVLLFDADSAGIQAAIRALPVVVGVVAEVRVSVPPAGLDPDDWIRQRGAEVVRGELERARTPVSFLEEQMVGGRLSRSEAASQAVALVEKIADPLVRELWVQEAAGRFGLSERAIVERLTSIAAKPDATQTPRSVEKWTPFETVCIRAALRRPERAGEIAALAEKLRARPRFLTVIRWLGERYEEGLSQPAQLIARAAEDLPNGGGLTSLPVDEDDSEPDVDGVIRLLRRRALRQEMADVTREIRRAAESGDEESLLRWQREKLRLLPEQAKLRDDSPTDPERDSFGFGPSVL